MMKCLIIPKLLGSQFCFAKGVHWCLLTSLEVTDLNIEDCMPSKIFAMEHHGWVSLDLGGSVCL